jgi:acetylornithine deacetylase
VSEARVNPVVIERIEASVQSLREEIAEALATLVRIPSQTGAEGAVQERVAALMRDGGLDVDIWEPDVAALRPYAEYVTLESSYAGRPNVVGVARGAGGGRSLILNAHIDTVETGDAAAWSVDPLGAEVRDGRMYGRGSCDMKGGLIANLFALRALRGTGFEPAGDLVLQSTISEEDGGAGALAAVLRGYVADAALISEPTNLAIVPAQGGSLMFRLHVPGLSAHACARDEGVSAIEKFAYLHRGLLAFEERHNREIAHPLYSRMVNKAPINIGTIRGGSWPSSVPELVVAEGRAGLVPGEDLEPFKERLTEEVSRLASADPWLREHPPRLEWLDGQFAAADVAIDAPLVSMLGNAWQQVTGTAPRIEAVTYGADMRHFVVTGGIDCVMFGAGDVRLAHAPDESIPLNDIGTAIATTAVFIAEWCGIVAS